MTHFDVPPIALPTSKDVLPTFNCAIIEKVDDEDTLICSGVLVSRRFILTIATKCIMKDNRQLSPGDVCNQIMTSSEIQDELETPKKAIHSHSDCRRRNDNYQATHDMALIQLEDLVDVDEHLRPAKLTEREELYQPGIQQFWNLSNYRIYHVRTPEAL